jgi:hypothetical protein
VKRRLQAQSLQTTLKDTLAGSNKYDSSKHCIQTILHEEGLHGFYKVIETIAPKSDQ